MKILSLLQTHRKQKKISQADFAQLLKISRRKLSCIENGQEPGLFLAMLISEILNIPLDKIWIKN